MTHLSCQSCDCGNYRNCKLRPPRELTSRERFFGFGIVALWLLIVALSVAGCKRDEVIMGRAKAAPIFTDPETGCEYYASWESYSDSYRVLPRTPRLGRDGKQICREVQKP